MSSNPPDFPVSPAMELIPTLVLLCSTDSQAIADLQRDVERRSGKIATIGALRWMPLNSTPSPDEIRQACEPLFSLDLWQRLIDAGYRSRLPDDQSPACVQIIVLWDGTRINKELRFEDLARSLQEAQESLTGIGNILCVLIAMDDLLQPELIDLFRPRIRLGQVALGGARVSRARVLDVCHHLLVALIGSNFLRVMDDEIAKKEASVGWLVVGASALRGMDSAEVRGLLRELVLRKVLEKALSPLSGPEKEKVEKAAKSEAQKKVRRALVSEATKALQGNDPKGTTWWKVELQEQEEDLPAVVRCTLTFPELQKAIFGPYRWMLVVDQLGDWIKALSAEGGFLPRRAAESLRRKPDWIKALSAEGGFLRGLGKWITWLGKWIAGLAKPFRPTSDLEERLSDHYRNVTHQIEQGLARCAREEYQRLEERFLGLFLDRALIFLGGSPATIEELPVGLEAVISALQGVKRYLSGEGDLKKAQTQDNIRPIPLTSESYLQAAAEMDAHIARENIRRYGHFARTLASLWGVLLNLLPAWLVGAFLLSALLAWSAGKALLVVGLALLGIGAVELVYWWLMRARRLLKKIVRENVLPPLQNRILRLTARILRDYRWWMLTRLQDTEQILTDLDTLLRERYRKTGEAWETIQQIRSEAREGTYFLRDASRIREWAEEAREEIDRLPEERRVAVEPYVQPSERIPPFDSFLTALIAEKLWPLSRTPVPPWAVLMELESAVEEQCAKKVDEQIELIQPGIIAEQVEALKKGKRWEWLWQQAQPLGTARATAAAFTVIVAPEEFLTGPTGRESRHWQPDWKVAKPRETLLEEICIRGFMEPERGK